MARSMFTVRELTQVIEKCYPQIPAKERLRIARRIISEKDVELIRAAKDGCKLTEILIISATGRHPHVILGFD